MNNIIKCSESLEQQKLMNWSAFASATYPELSLLFHIPNGGKRNTKEAANLKRQGVKAGVPDLCLPVARGQYHALYIEMKVGKNKATKKQLEWLQKLREQGNYTVICYGWEQASQILLLYINEKI